MIADIKIYTTIVFSLKIGVSNFLKTHLFSILAFYCNYTCYLLIMVANFIRIVNSSDVHEMIYYLIFHTFKAEHRFGLSEKAIISTYNNGSNQANKLHNLDL